jgi:4-hydroxy-tetrahydrodipicolinate synthase
LRRGIWAAALTPVDAGLQPDSKWAARYYATLLEGGCDGVLTLGTTGEAMSFGTPARLEFMEGLVAAGLPLDRLIVGTGAAALDDAARLTKGAGELGFSAALVMPPFFLRDVGDDGVLRYFDALFSRTSNVPVLLYNFPAMSGIAFSPALVDRFIEAFGERIGGVKDSSNDASLQRELLKRHPDLSLFPGSEARLPEALRYGAWGCISGSVALWPELAQRVYRDPTPDAAAQLSACRGTLDGLRFIPAVRRAVAQLTGDDDWERAMPPLTQLSTEEREALDRRLAAVIA